MTDQTPLAVATTLAPLVQAVLPGHHSLGRGVHGVVHWARVLENGLRIADATGANRTVVALFAIFHDARRVNDHIDPGHGARGAQLAAAMHEQLIGITAAELELLEWACRDHTEGFTDGDPTVQACWDADRLDLPRVRIRIRPDRLCTDFARDQAVIDWATERARGAYRPEFVEQWRQ